MIVGAMSKYTMEKYSEEILSKPDETQCDDLSSVVSSTTDNDTKTSSDIDNSVYSSNKDNSSDTSSEAGSNYNRDTKSAIWDEEEQFNQSRTHESAMAAQEALFRSGYDVQAAAYYGWLPGITPMRFPAFFYPPQFVGFTPNMALPGNNPNFSTNQENNEKYYTTSKHYMKQDNKQTNEIKDSVSLYLDGLAISKSQTINDLAKTKDTISDIDEGLVLEENDSEMSDTSLVQWQEPKTSAKNSARRVATVSVIQENNSIKRPITQIQENMENVENEQSREPTKRGRASTRQIAKTDQYWDRRKKNNVSAKKSRDARRQREVMTNQRSAMLEGENLRLRAELATTREENERLKKKLSSFKPN